MENSENEASVTACILSFSSRLNCVHFTGKLSYFADMNLRKSLLSHQIAIFFCLTLGDTREQVDKKIVPSFQGHFLIQRCDSFPSEVKTNDLSINCTAVYANI